MGQGTLVRSLRTGVVETDAVWEKLENPTIGVLIQRERDPERREWEGCISHSNLRPWRARGRSRHRQGWARCGTGGRSRGTDNLTRAFRPLGLGQGLFLRFRATNVRPDCYGPRKQLQY